MGIYKRIGRFRTFTRYLLTSKKGYFITMQFANQAISYFVSGFLCIIWMFLPMLGIADATELLKNILKQIKENLKTTCYRKRY